MATDQHLLGSCFGCSTPADEWPDSLDNWIIQIVTVEEDRTGLTQQEYVRCDTDPHCPGHPVERRLYCLPCQKEHKIEPTPRPHR